LGYWMQCKRIHSSSSQHCVILAEYCAQMLWRPCLLPNCHHQAAANARRKITFCRGGLISCRTLKVQNVFVVICSCTLSTVNQQRSAAVAVSHVAAFISELSPVHPVGTGINFLCHFYTITPFLFLSSSAFNSVTFPTSYNI